jgi:hypothetical protein
VIHLCSMKVRPGCCPISKEVTKDELEREIRDIRWVSRLGEHGERRFLEDDVQTIVAAVWTLLKEGESREYASGRRIQESS